MTNDDISYEALLDNLWEGVCFVGNDRSVIYWNNGAERITGLSRQEVQQRCLKDGALHHLDRDGAPCALGEHPVERCLLDGIVREEETFMQHAEGHAVPVYVRVSPIRNGAGETIGAMEVFSDDSSRIESKQRIEELEEMALLCPTTGVGNRRYSEMALTNAFEELRRFGWSFGVLFVDLDHFKNINDTYGHTVGDDILQMAAHALRSSLRSFDFVGRWGGEEFIVLLPNITDDILRIVAERCRTNIGAARYQHEGKEIAVTASIGAVLATQEEALDACVARADALMYESKRRGRNQVTTEEASGEAPAG